MTIPRIYLQQLEEAETPKKLLEVFFGFYRSALPKDGNYSVKTLFEDSLNFLLRTTALLEKTAGSAKEKEDVKSSCEAAYKGLVSSMAPKALVKAFNEQKRFLYTGNQMQLASDSLTGRISERILRLPEGSDFESLASKVTDDIFDIIRDAISEKALKQYSLLPPVPHPKLHKPAASEKTSVTAPPVPKESELQLPQYIPGYERLPLEPTFTPTPELPTSTYIPGYGILPPPSTSTPLSHPSTLKSASTSQDVLTAIATVGVVGMALKIWGAITRRGNFASVATNDATEETSETRASAATPREARAGAGAASETRDGAASGSTSRAKARARDGDGAASGDTSEARAGAGSGAGDTSETGVAAKGSAPHHSPSKPRSGPLRGGARGGRGKGNR